MTIRVLYQPFLSALQDASTVNLRESVEFLEDKIKVLEQLPVVGSSCLQEDILRFVVSLRASLLKRQHIASFVDM